MSVKRNLEIIKLLKMKKLFIVLGAIVLLGFSACGGLSGDKEFDETLLYGKWQEGTVYERYFDTPFERVLATGDTVRVNGITWDTSDDISEDEAQVFNWTLKGSTLTHEHIGIFESVPKVYTINSLTSNELTYSDSYGNTYYYLKVD